MAKTPFAAPESELHAIFTMSLSRLEEHWSECFCPNFGDDWHIETVWTGLIVLVRNIHDGGNACLQYIHNESELFGEKLKKSPVQSVMSSMY